MFITSNLLSDLIAILVAVAVVAVAYMKWSYTYWKRKGVLSSPASIPFGSAGAFFRNQVSIGEFFKRQYDYFRRQGAPFGGLYLITRKYFIPVDPVVLKHVLQNDFTHFMNRGGFSNEEMDPLNGHLFTLEDAKWKRMREKLTPTFTSGKMKMMFPTMVACGQEVVEVLEKASKNRESLDIKEILSRFSTDVLASVVFGVDSNCQKNPNSDFRKYGKMVFDLSFKELLTFLLPFIMSPDILKRFRFKSTKEPVEHFMMNLVKETVKYREEKNIFRKDVMHLLIQLKNLGKVTDDEKVTDGKTVEDGFTLEQIAAQAFVFFAAGFETSATTMTFALYELALNQDLQRRLREEINSVLKKNNNECSYDSVNEMKYLEQVFAETFRKYPPAAFSTRICTKDFKIPDTDTVVEKDTMAVIPIYGVHRDHEFYPNPEKFDPERFNEENKAKRTPGTYIPFGDGPRICIGSRFAIMQTKVGLISILKDYEVSVNRKTTVPIEMDPNAFFLASKEDIHLDVVKCT